MFVDETEPWTWCSIFRELDQHTKLMVLLHVASGMEYLHSMNVIHFDLKGANLLVNFGDPQRPVCKVFTIVNLMQN